MITLAKKRFDIEMNRKKEDLLYLKGVLHFTEGNFDKAISYFRRSEHASARYMQVLAHLKIGEPHNARLALDMYHRHVSSWQEGEHKELAIERISELARMLLP